MIKNILKKQITNIIGKERMIHWTPESTNFHPTHPESWEGVVPVSKESLPKIMVQTYEKWG